MRLWSWAKRAGRVLLLAYAIFSTISTIYLMLKLGDWEASHREAALTAAEYEYRMQRIEKLWGIGERY